MITDLTIKTEQQAKDKAISLSLSNKSKYNKLFYPIQSRENS